MSESKKLYLICDCWGPTQLQFVESKKTKRDGRVVFYGPFTETDRANRNNRIYPDNVMRPEFNRLAKLASEGKLMGEADHPSDSVIHIQGVSHRIMRMWWDDHRPNVGWCECITTSTANGMILEGLLNDGVPIGISSRGVGSGAMNRNGNLVISEGFRLVTGDIVGDPSYQEAWMNIKESVENDIKVGRKRFSLNGIEIHTEAKPLPIVSTRIEEAIEAKCLPIVDTPDPLPVGGVIEKVSLEHVLAFAASAAAKAIKKS